MDAGLEKEEHAPETEEYGISSTVFRCSSMPFHPGRLNEILTGFGTYGSALEASKQMLANASEAGDSSGAGDSSRAENTASKVFQGVVRSKGHVWLANAHAFPLSIHYFSLLKMRRYRRHQSFTPSTFCWYRRIML